MAARKRVAALVSGGIHFHVKRDHDRIAGARGHSGAKLWTTLSSKGFHAEQTIDLQSRRAGEFRESIAAALPLLHRRGVKHLRIAFATTELGEDETPELRAQAVIDALTLGAAAPLVRGFASAHETLGGAKVLAVLLI